MQSKGAPRRSAPKKKETCQGQRDSACGTKDTSAQGTSGAQPTDTYRQYHWHRNDAGKMDAPKDVEEPMELDPPWQTRPVTAQACLCSLPSERTNSVVGVPGELPTRRAGSIPSISLKPPNTTDIPQAHLQDVPAIKNCVANSQGLCECFFPTPQPLCGRWHPFCTEPRGRAQERTQLPSGCCAGVTGGVPEGHHAP